MLGKNPCTIFLQCFEKLLVWCDFVENIIFFYHTWPRSRSERERERNRRDIEMNANAWVP
jgi:hypothetical protein